MFRISFCVALLLCTFTTPTFAGPQKCTFKSQLGNASWYKVTAAQRIETPNVKNDLYGQTLKQLGINAQFIKITWKVSDTETKSTSIPMEDVSTGYSWIDNNTSDAVKGIVYALNPKSRDSNNRLIMTPENERVVQTGQMLLNVIIKDHIDKFEQDYTKKLPPNAFQENQKQDPAWFAKTTILGLRFYRMSTLITEINLGEEYYVREHLLTNPNGSSTTFYSLVKAQRCDDILQSHYIVSPLRLP